MNRIRARVLAVALGAALSGCPLPQPSDDGGTGADAPDAGSFGDAANAQDASDAASEDASAVGDGAGEDAASTDAAGLDAELDANDVDAGVCDFCFPPNECIIATGCAPACAYTGRPEGTRCADNHGSCSDGFCILDVVECGDGTRQVAPDREGCDDGNNTDGDACSATCTPTLLIIAAEAGETNRPRAQAPAMAVDGAGSILFVWLGTISTPGTDPYRQLLGRIYSERGADAGVPFVLEDHVGLSQPLEPSVAGQASGWVVTWRSTAVEGGGGEQGGIAYRQVRHDGSLRPTRQANTTEHADQLDPAVVALSTGFVIVWSDTSSELVTADLRMREFDLFGTPASGELAATTTVAEDQGHAVASARGTADALGTEWVLAFTDTSDPSLEPRVRMRRFDRTTATDPSDFLVAHTWSAEPTVAMTDTDVIVGWTSRVSDAHGDVHVRRIVDHVVPADDTDVDPPYASTPATALGPSPADGLASVASFPTASGAGYVVAWHVDSAASGGPGVRFAAPSSVSLPPEAADLQGYFVPGSSDITLAATGPGLWVAWADASMTGVPDAFVAYLLPWD